MFTYVNSINECFSPCTVFHKLLNHFLTFQCNEHEEMNKFLCSLACTWMTIIESQFILLASNIQCFFEIKMMTAQGPNSQDLVHMFAHIYEVRM